MPLPDDSSSGRSFVPFVEATIPDTTERGALVGVFNDNGRQRMVVTAAMNAMQLHQQLLFSGILEWLTYGVHLGQERHWLSVHIDDFLLADERWMPELDCTIGDCPADVTAPGISVNEADLAYLQDWQQRNRLKLDLVWNGQGLGRSLSSSAHRCFTATMPVFKSRSV